MLVVELVRHTFGDNLKYRLFDSKKKFVWSTTPGKKDAFENTLQKHELWVTSKGEQGEKAPEHAFNSRDLRPLSDLQLAGRQLKDISFAGADLSNLNLKGTTLNHCKFEGARLSWCCLEQAKLIKADLQKAVFEEKPKLKSDKVPEKTNLKGADLRGANLSNTFLKYVNLEGADLRGATLLNVTCLEFDGNRITSTVFSPWMCDPWSILRRTYTGYKFIFHLLLLIGFIAPYFAKTAFWLGINKFQQRMVTVVKQLKEEIIDVQYQLQTKVQEAENLLKEVENLPPNTFEVNTKIDALLEPINKKIQGIDEKIRVLLEVAVLNDIDPKLVEDIESLRQDIRTLQTSIQKFKRSISQSYQEINSKLKKLLEELRTTMEFTFNNMNSLLQKISGVSPCFTFGECHTYQIWQLLLGWDKGWSNAILIIALLLYNIFRFILTYQVGPLREEEERSGYTPKKKEYSHLFLVHQINVGLSVVALGTLIYHLRFLFNYVSLP